MSLKILNFICSLLAFLAVVFSCTEDVNLEPDTTLLDQYYPIAEGDARTYLIDSITYDFDGHLNRIVIDTQRFYVQERVLESTQIHDESWWRIGLYRSDSPESAFQLNDYVYIRKTRSRLLRREGSLTFIPLASPLDIYSEWDGTAHFEPTKTNFFVEGEVISPYEDWNYIYLQNWETYQVDQTTYENVIQINQIDTLSIETDNGQDLVPPDKQLFYNLANEFYAPGVGLIEKEEYHLTSICASSNVNDFQVFCDTTTIFENAERGYIYRKKLIAIE